MDVEWRPADSGKPRRGQQRLRHLLLDWMPLVWLLRPRDGGNIGWGYDQQQRRYFLKLLTLTATYVAVRSRIERPPLQTTYGAQLKMFEICR